MSQDIMIKPQEDQLLNGQIKLYHPIFFLFFFVVVLKGGADQKYFGRSKVVCRANVHRFCTSETTADMHRPVLINTVPYAYHGNFTMKLEMSSEVLVFNEQKREDGNL